MNFKNTLEAAGASIWQAITGGREAEVKALASDEALLEKKGKSLLAAHREALAAQRYQDDIRNGVFVRKAETDIQVELGPIRARIAERRRKLKSAPPAPIEAFLQDCALKIDALRSSKGVPATVLRQNFVGDPLEATRYDTGEIDKAIEAIKKLMVAAGDLSTQDLTESELAKKVAALRAVELPEINPHRFIRESSFHGFREVTQ